MIEFTTRFTEHSGRSRILRSIIASGVLLMTAFGSVHVQTSFVETGVARGIEAFDHAAGMTAGMAVADYDNDGNIDLSVPAGDGSRGRLYQTPASASSTRSRVMWESPARATIARRCGSITTAMAISTSWWPATVEADRRRFLGHA